MKIKTKTGKYTSTTKSEDKNKHTFKGRVCSDREPNVETLEDGTLRIEAFGRHAIGEHRTFRIDPAQWERLSSAYGTRWNVIPSGGKRFFIRSSRRLAGRAAGQPGGAPAVAALARLITNAAPGRIVSYSDGDWRNLTYKNLAVGSRAQASGQRSVTMQLRFARHEPTEASSERPHSR